MLDRAALGFLNHLLAGESWARARLKPFAGRHGRIEAGPVGVGFVVEGDGLLKATPVRAADVSITLPDDAHLRFLTDRAGVLGAAHLSGNAEFAEALGFVMRNLRWDVEADLARVVGDVPARRLVTNGRAFVEGKAETVRRAADNLIEYAIGDGELLVRDGELAGFSAELSRLREDLDRLEARLR